MSKFPSQEHFNETHMEAHSYGEEDNYLLVSDSLTEDQAVKAIEDLLHVFYGDSDEGLDYYDIPNIGKISVSIGKNADGDPDYVVNSKEASLYQAWCVEQL